VELGGTLALRGNPTRDRQGQNWDSPEGTGEAGCGKTMLAREGFDGPRVLDNKNTPLRIGGRDRRVGRDEGEFEVRSSRFSELRTPNFELRIVPFSHVSRFARHGLWPLAEFSSILPVRGR